MDLLGPLPIRKSGNQFIIVITDLYSRLKKTIPSTRKTAIPVATIFVNHWIWNFDIQSTIPTVSSPQFTSKFFQAICAKLLITSLSTLKNHPQTTGQVE